MTDTTTAAAAAIKLAAATGLSAEVAKVEAAVSAAEGTVSAEVSALKAKLSTVAKYAVKALAGVGAGTILYLVLRHLV